MFLIVFDCSKCKQIGCNIAAHGFLASKLFSLLVNFRQMANGSQRKIKIKYLIAREFFLIRDTTEKLKVLASYMYILISVSEFNLR